MKKVELLPGETVRCQHQSVAGRVTVTNVRVIEDGARRHKSVTLGSILSVNVYPAGIGSGWGVDIETGGGFVGRIKVACFKRKQAEEIARAIQTPVAAPALSLDLNAPRWDGRAWVSPDGRYRWDGERWVLAS